MRISWLAMATKAETLPIRSSSSVASASRYAPARAPSGTVSTSIWRASISASRRASGPSKAGSVTRVAASGRRPSPNATVGAADPRPPSGGLVRGVEQGAVARVAGLGLVADEVDGERRAGRPLHELRRRVGVVRRAGRARRPSRAPAGRGARPTARTPRRATTRSSAARRCRPWRSRGAARRRARRGRARPSGGARRRRRGRGGGRRRASRRTGRARPGASQAASSACSAAAHAGRHVREELTGLSPRPPGRS